METHFSEKYSNLIAAEDVESLFENLVNAYGSIEKAAETCGVARTTPYGWQKAKYVKSATKMKVLKANLKENLMATLGFLTDKSKERTTDLLLTYLSSIYQKAMREDGESFEKLLHQFLDARRDHYGLIADEVQEEVGKMTHILRRKAREFQISVPQDPIGMIKSDYLQEIIPDVINDLFVERANLEEITSRYGVPIEFPLAIRNAWNAITPKLTSLAQPTGKEKWMNAMDVYMPSRGIWVRAKDLAKPEGMHVYTGAGNATSSLPILEEEGIKHV